MIVLLFIVFILAFTGLIKFKQKQRSSADYFISAILLLLSVFIIFRGYDSIGNTVWDEKFSIPAAYRVIEGINTPEYNPPLGPMIIALGEKIVSPNKHTFTSSLSKVYKLSKIPKGFSFKGVRLFPVLFSIAAIFMLYFTALQISGSRVIGMLASLMLLFDNGYIVHSRSAMLEGIQIFFILVVLFLFFKAKSTERISLRQIFVMGVLTSVAASIKLNGLVLVFLMPFIYWYSEYYSHTVGLINKIIDFLKTSVIFILGILVFMTFIWVAEFAVKSKKTAIYSSTGNYNNVVVAEDIKPDFKWNIFRMTEFFGMTDVKLKIIPEADRYSSKPINWIMGGKAMRYLWQKDNEGIKHLIYIMNPFVWLISVLSIIVAFSYVVSSVFFGFKYRNPKVKNIVETIALYVVYMCVFSRMSRALYLYHYLIPFMLSLLMFSSVIKVLIDELRMKRELITYIILLIIVVNLVGSFIFFSPFTYFKELSFKEFSRRNWSESWGLKYVNQ